ncbi:Integrase catalytic domain-containing protein [Candidatus Magnetomoraceae bacterium gMMP-15]
MTTDAAWKRELVNKLRCAPYGTKENVLKHFMSMTGYSRVTLLRHAKKNGYHSGRKTRRDKGKTKVNKEQIEFVTGLIHLSARKKKGTIMPVGVALEIAEDSGVIKKGQISRARMSAILRERNMNAKAINAPDPKIQMRSKHPNHVHIFDASICIQYYLKNGKISLMRENEYYHNKPQNFAKVKTKLIRYVLADHFSHSIFVKYYNGQGESQEMLYDFLISAWKGGKHEKFPFHGVPFFVLMDKGAANTSKAVLEFLKRLEIDIPDSLPNNPGRQGSAEVLQSIVERNFESKLRFQPATSIQVLNEWAVDWCAYYNGTKKHRRHKKTRTQCWLQITKEQLRELPAEDILHDLFAEPEVERTVSSRYSIDFRTKEYNIRHIPELVPTKTKVKVVLRPYHFPEVKVIHNDTEYLVQPIGTVAGGFREDAAIIGEEHKSMPKSKIQNIKEKAENLAYGEDRKKDDVPYKNSLNIFGNHAEKVKVDFLPRMGTPIETGQEIMDKEIPIIELLKEINEDYGPIAPEYNRKIREEYGKTITLTEKKKILAELAERELPMAVNY